MDTFLSRLLWVLGGQDKYPWCIKIGVGAGRGNTMFGTKDKPAAPPTAEALNAIRRYENVSTLWLLEGKGPRCLVNIMASDEDGSARLDVLLGEHDWAVHIVTDRRRYALVLTRPAQYQVKDRVIDYTDVEILAGALGGRTMGRLRAQHPPVALFAVDVDTATLETLIAGGYSNLQLLRADDALLARRRPLSADDRLWDWPVAEQTALSPDEKQLLDTFRLMPPLQRTMFLRIGRALLQGEEE